MYPFQRINNGNTKQMFCVLVPQFTNHRTATTTTNEQTKKERTNERTNERREASDTHAQPDRSSRNTDRRAYTTSKAKQCNSRHRQQSSLLVGACQPVEPSQTNGRSPRAHLVSPWSYSVTSLGSHATAGRRRYSAFLPSSLTSLHSYFAASHSTP